MYYVATLTSKGQITIPTEITKIMGLKPGDKVCIDEKQNRLEIYKQNVFNKKTQILL